MARATGHGGEESKPSGRPSLGPTAEEGTAAEPPPPRRRPVARAKETPGSSLRANKMAAGGDSGVLPGVRRRLGHGETSGGSGKGRGAGWPGCAQPAH